MLAFDQMEDDMRCEAVFPLLVAEPFAAGFVAAADHAALVA